jgi:hypothetical protein
MVKRASNWFLSHSIAWWYTLTKPNGIHNHSSRQSTFDELRFLSNGLRFIPTPKLSFESHRQDVIDGWDRFSNSITNQIIFRDKEQQCYEPKFSLSTRIKRQRFNPSNNDFVMGADKPIVQLFLKQTRSSLITLLDDASTSTATNTVRFNYRSNDMKSIRNLANDSSITFLSADKNLGTVAVDTQWYNNEVTKMLSDTSTYTLTDRANFEQVVDRIHKSILAIVGSYPGTIHLTEPMTRFLKHQTTTATTSIPTFYLLIKVHKPVLSGRPIVPGVNWITTPASVVLDHLLTPTLSVIPWLVKDTKSLILDLESKHQMHKDGVLISADISSLYTNIDTQLGVRLVQTFLSEYFVDKGWHTSKMTMVIELLKIVMNNNYLQFNGRIYHQHDGTAMGTNVAPAYANIFVFMLERKFVKGNPSVFLYRRLLDDVFMYVQANDAHRVQHELNSWHNKIKFTFNCDPNAIAFLDLEIFKGERFIASGCFDIRIHQKAMNKYLYIPFKSFHTTPMKHSFIYTELIRYIRNNNNVDDYVKVKWDFYRRLRERGYPPAFLMSTFQSIYYEDRPLLLLPASSPLSSLTLQPQSSFLIKRMQREQQAAASSLASPSTMKSNRLVFVVFNSPLSHVLSIRNILVSNWDLVNDEFPHIPRPIIAYKSHNTLGAMLKHKQTKQTNITLDAEWTTKQGKQNKTKTKTKQKPKPQPSITHFFK